VAQTLTAADDVDDRVDHQHDGGQLVPLGEPRRQAEDRREGHLRRVVVQAVDDARDEDVEDEQLERRVRPESPATRRTSRRRRPEASSSPGVPISTMPPWSITTMRSARWAVVRRCAMRIAERPSSSRSRAAR
jgi:hypothetical protein